MTGRQHDKPVSDKWVSDSRHIAGITLRTYIIIRDYGEKHTVTVANYYLRITTEQMRAKVYKKTQHNQVPGIIPNGRKKKETTLLERLRAQKSNNYFHYTVIGSSIGTFEAIAFFHSFCIFSPFPLVFWAYTIRFSKIVYSSIR